MAQYLKVNSEITSTTSGIVDTNSEEVYLYVKKYDNGKTGSAAVKFPLLHVFGPKNTGTFTNWDGVLATNPKVVEVTNTANTCPCDCNLGSVFVMTQELTYTYGVTITTSHVPATPGFGILVKFSVGTDVTINYNNKEIFNTKTGSDYTAGTYYASFLVLSASDSPLLQLVNFFKAP